MWINTYYDIEIRILSGVFSEETIPWYRPPSLRSRKNIILTAELKCIV